MLRRAGFARCLRSAGFGGWACRAPSVAGVLGVVAVEVATEPGVSPAAIAGSEPMAVAASPAAIRAMERRRVTAGIVPWREAVKVGAGDLRALACAGDHEVRIAKARALLTAWTAMGG